MRRTHLLLSALVSMTSVTAATAGGVTTASTAPSPVRITGANVAAAPTPPTPALSYALARRAELFSSSWISLFRFYLPTYVKPTTWTIRLDACATQPGRDSTGKLVPVSDYTWRLVPLEGQPASTLISHGPTCARNVSLKALGTWQLQLTVTDQQHRVASRVSNTKLRDLLVVSLGDSYSSGEGNPGPGGAWIDKACHRSANGWPARVARSLQTRDTTVTFLSYACSGATLAQLYTTTTGRPSQVAMARGALGSPTLASTRRIDALLLSGGVNDLGFADILTDCALPGGDPCRRSLTSTFNALPGRYAALQRAVTANLKVAHTYIADYPARLFTNAADNVETCGFPFYVVPTADGAWINQQGTTLDGKIQTAATVHHWVDVHVTDPFRHHGYCAGSATWFRSWLSSQAVQGDQNGTGHPNGAGHQKVADLMTPQVRARL
jgi:lysophospholipase L1-like esterase